MSYGFGIMGLGLIADFHAKAIQATDQGDVAACYSRSQKKADAFGAEHGCTGYADMQAFLAHPGLDVVTICTPSGFHLEPAVAAAEAGKHVIIEKPLEVTLERCDRIITACAQQGVKLAGIFQSRFSDVAGVIKNTLDEGRFGQLVLGDAYVKWYRSQQYYDEGGWHGTWKLDGGGALINQSIHAVDLLQWFMGDVAAVTAFSGTRGHTGIEVEDVAVAALQFQNGAFGVIEGSTAVYPGFLKKIEISGVQGSLVLEEDSLTTWSFADERDEDTAIRTKFGAKTTSAGGAVDPGAIKFEGHQRQFEDFMTALETDSTPLIDGPEARKAVEIILAIYQSACEGRTVRLPL